MYRLTPLVLLLTACVSRAPATVTTVPNPFDHDAPIASPTPEISPAPPPALAPAPPTPAPPAPLLDKTPENSPEIIGSFVPTNDRSKQLMITSWNVKHLGRKSFNLKNNDMLDSADIIAFQEVNKSKSGVKALNALRVGIAARTNRIMCYAVTPPPSGSVEIYGFIWRDDRLAFIKRDGEVIEHCGKNAIMVALAKKHADTIVREPAIFTAIFKPNGRPFALASVHLLPEQKNPENEVDDLFDSFADVKIPIVVAGDFNLDGKPPEPGSIDHFAKVRKLGYLHVFNGLATSLKSKTPLYNKALDHIWYRDTDFDLRGLGMIDILNIFGKENMDIDTIRKTISDHAPISAGFEFK